MGRKDKNIMVETYFAFQVYGLYAMIVILAICGIVIIVSIIHDNRKK